MRALRNLGLFVAISVVPVLVVLLYILRTYINTTSTDGFIFVPLAGAVADGTWRLTDLISHYYEHLLIGYAIINVVNAKLFSLNMMLDPILFLWSYVAIAWVLYRECSRISGGSTKHLLCMFIPLACLCYSLVSPPLILMTTQFTWGTALAVYIAYLMQKDFDRQGSVAPANFILLVVAILLYFVIFSGSYFPGLVGGLCCMVGVRCAVIGRWHGGRSFLVILLAVACSATYVYEILIRLPDPDHTPLLNKLMHAGNHPIESLQFLNAGIGCSVVAGRTIASHMDGVLYIGMGVSCIVLFATFLFVRIRMYQVTTMPVFLMGYTLAELVAVRLGRGTYGDWTWITNEWYGYQFRPLILGTTWILIYAFLESRGQQGSWFRRLAANRGAPCYCLAALTFICSCEVVSNIDQWHGAPAIQLKETARRAAVFFPTATNQSILEWPPSDVSYGRLVLMKHHLSCFAHPDWTAYTHGSLEAPVHLGYWYRDGWIGREAAAVFQTDRPKTVSLRGTADSALQGNHITIVMDRRVVYDRDLSPGSDLQLTAPVGTGFHEMEIYSAKTMHHPGIYEQDASRNLSVLVRSISFE